MGRAAASQRRSGTCSEIFVTQNGLVLLDHESGIEFACQYYPVMLLAILGSSNVALRRPILDPGTRQSYIFLPNAGA